jgi:photoactive yellow protein
MDLLPASKPEEVVDQVRELQISVLDEEAEALEDMGLTDAEEAKTVLQRIFQRLQKLRRENQALQHLQEAVGADSPDEVAASIDELRERVRTLEKQQRVLSEAGYDRPEHVLQALDSMEQQLDELYGEKEATEQSGPETEFLDDGDTFDQLQALMAREEKLQRELGVSSPDAVVEMVEGLSDQLEDVYRDRDDEVSNSIFAPAPEQPDSPNPLEEELGVSNPDDVITMINDLKDQLDALYADRRRLAEHNLNGADDAIQMLESMQRQLESLYEGQAEMSEHGINGVNHALSMIDSMEAQLSELYEERYQLAQQGVDDPDTLSLRIETLEDKLSSLREEKEALRERRDRLQTQFEELEAELGTDDPTEISELVGSLEAQLEDLYQNREEDARPQPVPDDAPVLADDTIAELEDLDQDALNALPAGVFCVDDQGNILRANDTALQWPDAVADAPEALAGANFFEDVAPASNNALFRGRFEDGVGAGQIDERFFYTYVSEHAPPTNLVVHLHSKPTEAAYWILFRLL